MAKENRSFMLNTFGVLALSALPVLKCTTPDLRVTEEVRNHEITEREALLLEIREHCNELGKSMEERIQKPDKAKKIELEIKCSRSGVEGVCGKPSEEKILELAQAKSKSSSPKSLRGRYTGVLLGMPEQPETEIKCTGKSQRLGGDYWREWAKPRDISFVNGKDYDFNIPVVEVETGNCVSMQVLCTTKEGQQFYGELNQGFEPFILEEKNPTKTEEGKANSPKSIEERLENDEEAEGAPEITVKTEPEIQVLSKKKISETSGVKKRTTQNKKGKWKNRQRKK